ncbi:uncharacterized protein ANIA_11603 [Aspergillus nidulans FGSC A4]|uniref:Uncharacterized protein n=1 Tax=Emericella nidulans (strain FGSC A4 / ATCC 38163 / CBS 112.46 / NRRL 194 / M139) TaxID=227321 RepID=C8VE66_EMENI|nr:hypothetical protein [Aspergillus nidulans FGSC A4]CBF80403.1 TPA: hypothetical protein ANIA_11603 [Aspergillus nidulans FGSC A4]
MRLFMALVAVIFSVDSTGHRILVVILRDHLLHGTSPGSLSSPHTDP